MRKAPQSLLDAQQIQHRECNSQHHGSGDECFPSHAAYHHYEREEDDLASETNDSAPRAGEQQRTNLHRSKDADNEQALATDLAKRQRHERQRGGQLRECREMVAVYIWAKGDSSKMHFAEPVKFSVKGQVLEDSKDGYHESENHEKPDEASPVLQGAKRLGRKAE